MSKARTLADFISDGSEFADGTISVAEVSGAAPTASPTFTGTVTAGDLTLSDGTPIINITDTDTGVDHQINASSSIGNLAINVDQNNEGSNAGLIFRVGGSGTANQYFRMAANGDTRFYDSSANTMLFIDESVGVTINDDGANKDFRVESDSNTHMLYVDGADNRVGIGTSDPRATLEVYGSNPGLRITDSQTTITGGTGLGSILFNNSDNSGGIEGDWYINNVAQDGFGRTDLEVRYYSNYVGDNFAFLSFDSNPFGVVINEDSSTMSFRVESNTNTHALYVEPSNSRVGINNSTPSEQLTVNGSALFQETEAEVRIFNNGSDPAEWRLMSSSNSGATAAFRIYNNTTGSNDFWIAGSTNGGAAAGYIGIGGNADPQAPLHLIAGSSGGSLSDAFQISDSGYVNIAMYSGGADGEIRVGAAGTLRGVYKAQYAGTRTANDFSVGANLINAITFDSGGPVKVNAGGNSLVDFRVESDTYSHMLFVDAGSNFVSVGSVNPSLASGFNVTPTATYGNTVSHRAADGIGGSGQRANMVSGILTIETTSSGNQLTIPVTYSGSFWAQYYVRLVVVSAEYNMTSAKAGEATFAFGAATSIANLTTLSTTGNITSIGKVNASSPNPHTLQINFSNAYTAGLNNWEGIQLYYEIVSSWPDRIQMQNAALN